MQLQQQVDSLRKETDDIKKLLKGSEQTFVGKLEDYGEHVTGIESRIGSIERVFRDFLPELTENIRVMSSMVEKVKKEEKKK